MFYYKSLLIGLLWVCCSANPLFAQLIEDTNENVSPIYQVVYDYGFNALDKNTPHTWPDNYYTIPSGNGMRGNLQFKAFAEQDGFEKVGISWLDYRLIYNQEQYFSNQIDARKFLERWPLRHLLANGFEATYNNSNPAKITAVNNRLAQRDWKDSRDEFVLDEVVKQIQPLISWSSVSGRKLVPNDRWEIKTENLSMDFRVLEHKDDIYTIYFTSIEKYSQNSGGIHTANQYGLIKFTQGHKWPDGLSLIEKLYDQQKNVIGGVLVSMTPAVTFLPNYSPESERQSATHDLYIPFNTKPYDLSQAKISGVLTVKDGPMRDPDPQLPTTMDIEIPGIQKKSSSYIYLTNIDNIRVLNQKGNMLGESWRAASPALIPLYNTENAHLKFDTDFRLQGWWLPDINEISQIKADIVLMQYTPDSSLTLPLDQTTHSVSYGDAKVTSEPIAGKSNTWKLTFMHNQTGGDKNIGFSTSFKESVSHAIYRCSPILQDIQNKALDYNYWNYLNWGLNSSVNYEIEITVPNNIRLVGLVGYQAHYQRVKDVTFKNNNAISPQKEDTLTPMIISSFLPTNAEKSGFPLRQLRQYDLPAYTGAVSLSDSMSQKSTWYSLEGNRLYTVDKQYISVWDAENGNLLFQWLFPQPVWGIAVNPDQTLIAFQFEDRVSLFQLKEFMGEPIHEWKKSGFSKPDKDLYFSKDGNFLTIRHGNENGIIKLKDFRYYTSPLITYSTPLAISNDGLFLLGSYQYEHALISFDRWISEQDQTTEQQTIAYSSLYKLLRQEDKVNSDGRWAQIMSPDSYKTIFFPKSGQKIRGSNGEDKVNEWEARQTLSSYARNMLKESPQREQLISELNKDGDRLFNASDYMVNIPLNYTDSQIYEKNKNLYLYQKKEEQSGSDTEQWLNIIDINNVKKKKERLESASPTKGILVDKFTLNSDVSDFDWQALFFLKNGKVLINTTRRILLCSEMIKSISDCQSLYQITDETTSITQISLNADKTKVFLMNGVSERLENQRSELVMVDLKTIKAEIVMKFQGGETYQPYFSTNNDYLITRTSPLQVRIDRQKEDKKPLVITLNSPESKVISANDKLYITHGNSERDFTFSIYNLTNGEKIAEDHVCDIVTLCGNTNIKVLPVLSDFDLKMINTMYYALKFDLYGKTGSELYDYVIEYRQGLSEVGYSTNDINRALRNDSRQMMAWVKGEKLAIWEPVEDDHNIHGYQLYLYQKRKVPQLLLSTENDHQVSLVASNDGETLLVTLQGKFILYDFSKSTPKIKSIPYELTNIQAVFTPNSRGLLLQGISRFQKKSTLYAY